MKKKEAELKKNKKKRKGSFTIHVNNKKKFNHITLLSYMVFKASSNLAFNFTLV
jgi:hypothetical protein